MRNIRPMGGGHAYGTETLSRGFGRGSVQCVMLSGLDGSLLMKTSCRYREVCCYGSFHLSWMREDRFQRSFSDDFELIGLLLDAPSMLMTLLP